MNARPLCTWKVRPMNSGTMVQAGPSLDGLVFASSLLLLHLEVELVVDMGLFQRTTHDACTSDLNWPCLLFDDEDSGIGPLALDPCAATLDLVLERRPARATLGTTFTTTQRVGVVVHGHTTDFGTTRANGAAGFTEDHVLVIGVPDLTNGPRHSTET